MHLENYLNMMQIVAMLNYAIMF